MFFADDVVIPDEEVEEPIPFFLNATPSSHTVSSDLNAAEKTWRTRSFEDFFGEDEIDGDFAEQFQFSNLSKEISQPKETLHAKESTPKNLPEISSVSSTSSSYSQSLYVETLQLAYTIGRHVRNLL